MIDLYLACVKLGVIFVPINVLYKDREIAHILKDAEPALFLQEPPQRPQFRAAERPAVTLDGDTPAGIIYTSGTTGASKGAVLTHNNFAANAVNLLACWQITAADRFLLALPLFHVHGLGNGLHCWLMSRLPHAPAAALRTPEGRRRIPRFPPDALLRRADHLRPPARNRGGQAREIGAFMRLFVSGSAPLPGARLRRVPRPVRPHHPRALRNEREPDEHQQPVHRRAPAGNGRTAAARRLGASWWMARST